jgi:hypothetical protein
MRNMSPRVAVCLPLRSNDHTIRAGLVQWPIGLPRMHREPISNALVNTITIPPLPGPATVTSPSKAESTALNPEQIVSYDYQLPGLVSSASAQGSSADLFFNHISDLISFVSQPIRRPRRSGHVPTTEESADIYGGEVGFEVFGYSMVVGLRQLCYEHIGQTFSGTTTRGAPRSKFNLGIRMEWENGLNAETTFHHVWIRFLPDRKRLLLAGTHRRISSTDDCRRQLQPAQSSRRVSLLAAEGRGGLYARRRSGRLRLQRAQRRTQRTSAGRPHRQTGDGMGHRKILMESSACSKQGFSA